MKKNNIQYKVQFFDLWHTGSGLAAGADVDALVIKDKDNLPYIPGKTMKGLVREALETILRLRNDEKKLQVVENNFGLLEENISEDGRETDFQMKRGEVFFKNATLSDELIKEITANQHLHRYIFQSISSTAIKDGIAKEHSLRRTETTIPVTLYGEILNVDSNITVQVKEALGFIKRLGVGRNRGLGRCQFTILKEEEA